MNNFFYKEYFDDDSSEKYKEDEIRDIVETKKHWTGYSNEKAMGYCHVYEIFKHDDGTYSIKITVYSMEIKGEKLETYDLAINLLMDFIYKMNWM